jgi:uncharacterized protein YycO
MRILLFLILPLTLIFSESAFCQQFSNYQTGDIIFQTSQSSQSKVIQLATNSKLSHVGIIVMRKGGCFVYEAVQPVKFTPLKAWIQRGENGFYSVKRLTNSEEIFKQKENSELIAICEKYLGKNYDLYFEWSDDRIYCSELVWKVYHDLFGIEVGKLTKLADFDLTSQAVKSKMTERYGENIPFNEAVISPQAVFESDKLFTVYDNYE